MKESCEGQVDRYLVEGIDETLEASKVTDQLEDPHHSHHSPQPDNLTSFAHYLKVLTRMMMMVAVWMIVKVPYL